MLYFLLFLLKKNIPECCNYKNKENDVKSYNNNENINDNKEEEDDKKKEDITVNFDDRTEYHTCYHGQSSLLNPYLHLHISAEDDQ